MRADLFYQNHAEPVLPLILLSKEQWASDSENLNVEEKNYIEFHQFNANPGETCVMLNAQGIAEKVFIGMGTKDDAHAIAHAVLRLPPGNYRCPQKLSSLAMANWALAQYRFDRYKKHDYKPRVLIIEDALLGPVLQGVEAIFTVRDLINTPTNDMMPRDLAQATETLAKQYKAEFIQYVGDELLEANYPAVHSVGRASACPPRMLILNWGKKNAPKVTLVGKGVCFDSGGLDIKPSSAMRLMKKDMGGAAHALGLAQWIMARKLPVRLQVLIPAVENAISANAFRPGDVINMRNGLTVEIDNTDAEGRLILADALVKACEEKPDLILDFATLTGAARVAVGTEIAAMFSDDDAVAQALYDASCEVTDPVWRLPLHSAYEHLLDSSVADLANCSHSPYAGAITAALFLKRFVPKEIPWVHFDIMAWNVTSKPGKPEGGEAMAIRAIAHYLQKKYR